MDRKREMAELREAAAKNIRPILHQLGIVFEDRGGQLRAPCPIHGGDNRTAFSWSDDHKQFRCWTNQCHEKGSSALDIIANVKNLSIYDAAKWVKTMNYNVTNLAQGEADNFAQAMRNNGRKRIFELKEKGNDFKYLESRGFSTQEIKNHGGFSCSTGPLKDRIVFPLEDIDGKLIAYTGRTLFNKTNDGLLEWEQLGISKWMHWGDVGTSFFNLTCAAPHIKKNHAVLLCEGPLDVLRLEQAGVQIAVACLGASLVGSQDEVLISLGATKVYMGFDGDKAGLTGAEKTKKRLTNKTVSSDGQTIRFDIYQIKFPQGVKDWAELNITQIRSICDQNGLSYSRED
jgi:5S rRNA maturation endonuclease (ribonuclease M5)